MPRLIQPSFAKGELSPALFGRVDTEAYQVGLRQAKNVISHPFGGMSSRGGTQFLSPVKDHTKDVRLIPFQFKTTDQYVIEMGDLYMRFIRNDGHVLEADDTITGATQADPVVVTVSNSYSNGDEIFIDDVVGMTELNTKRFIVQNVTGSTVELTDQVTGVDIDGTAFTAYSSGGTSARVFTLVTPYLEADLFDITYVQSADVMTLCHKDHAIRELNRLANDDWTLTEPTFAPTLDDPTAVVVTVDTSGSETQSYKVTAIDRDTGEESLPGVNMASLTITNATQADPVVITTSASHNLITGDEVQIGGIVGMTELNGRRFFITEVDADEFELDDEDGTGYTAYTSDGVARTTFVRITNGADPVDNTVSWTAVSGANRYAVYRQQNGLWGLIGETVTNSFKDDNIAPDTGNSFPEGTNPFEGDNNPGAVTFYQQRRVFGGSTEFPDTSWFSKTGLINNFGTTTPSVSDDAITASLTSREVNEIRQYVPGSDLLTFTSGGEWRINGGPDTVLAPETIQQKPQTYWGTSFRPPLTVGNTVIYTTAESNGVRSIGFELASDSYTGSDMLLLAEHLLEDDTIKDWAYVRDPESRIYVVLASGKALSFTFDDEQQVTAWTRWDTDGKYKSVASLRGGGPENEGSVYFVVERLINSNTVEYIEVYRQLFFDDVRDCRFSDSFLSLDTPLAIESISLTDPVVVTITGHGFSDTDLIDIADIEWVPDVDDDFNTTQPNQLNDLRFKVANKTANTFELTDEMDVNIDGTAFNAYIAEGTVRKAVTTVSGLEHLEGEAVVILSDGNVVTSHTVTDAAITLARPASRVHVGLRYLADIETLDIEVPGGTTVQGQLKRVPEVTIRFRRSRGLLIGPDSDNLDEMKQREFELYGEPTRLLTGDKTIDIPPSWNKTGRIFLRQKDPLPMTILAIIPILQIGDDQDTD